jgi:hypothetical protein
MQRSTDRILTTHAGSLPWPDALREARSQTGSDARVHPEIAWSKFKALEEGARLASKQLWR